MTKPNLEEFATIKLTAQFVHPEMGKLYPAHVPIVDLPETVMRDVPEGERWRGFDVRLQDRAVILCLN